MNFVVDNIRVIEEEYLSNFVLKEEISEVETYGLEMCLVKLLMDVGYGIERAQYMVDMFTRHLEDCLDILDGCDDILHIDTYKILSVHLTENGIAVLKCLKEDSEYYDGDESVYFATIG